MGDEPELILICCEGNTEASYFNILKKCFRLPTYVKILPDPDSDYHRLGQHERLIDNAVRKRNEYSQEFDLPLETVELWAVCDRDNYKESYTILNNYAAENEVNLAFSDPQFESFLLQHFSPNKFAGRSNSLIAELSRQIVTVDCDFTVYRKGDLGWLDNMIEKKHEIVKEAVKNAEIFSNHTKQPFFTVQKLVNRLLGLSD